jgi:hypothetical protein
MTLLLICGTAEQGWGELHSVMKIQLAYVNIPLPYEV